LPVTTCLVWKREKNGGKRNRSSRTNWFLPVILRLSKATCNFSAIFFYLFLLSSSVLQFDFRFIFFPPSPPKRKQTNKQTKKKKDKNENMNKQHLLPFYRRDKKK